MRLVKIILFRQEAVGISFVPLTQDKIYSHVVVITRGHTTIGTDYLEKGKEIDEKTAEAFYKKYTEKEQ